MPSRPPAPAYEMPATSVNSSATVEAVSVLPGNGLNWFTDAWTLFKASPWILIAMWLLLMIITTAANLVPMLGPLLTPALLAGFALAVAKLDHGEKIEILSLFDAFKSHTGPLLMLGGIFILAVVLIIAVCGLSLAIMLTAMGSGTMGSAIGSLILIVLATLVFLSVLFAMWWAPCLVVFHQQPPTEAVKNAIKAIFKNKVASLVYGLIMIGLYLMVAVTVGLGLVVVGPLVIISAYTSYKDIFKTV